MALFLTKFECLWLSVVAPLPHMQYMLMADFTYATIPMNPFRGVEDQFLPSFILAQRPFVGLCIFCRSAGFLQGVESDFSSVFDGTILRAKSIITPSVYSIAYACHSPSPMLMFLSSSYILAWRGIWSLFMHNTSCTMFAKLCSRLPANVQQLLTSDHKEATCSVSTTVTV
ncbi:Hypothetical predicted protein [Podarcis lilfordi]|uniref:Secreted protein n=1 Tax=Podarcis lilfordi TaxID=74358 RepID=A0AA35JQI7_9SAUR|nr:Hypothetical predicted protein [Podarcis lilfordi]